MKTRFLPHLLALTLLPIIGQAATADSAEDRRERAAERIEQALERDRVLGRFDLDADAEGGRTGHIELEGKVQNASQRNRAISIAHRIAPGYRIVNRIETNRPGFMGRHR